MKKNRKWMSLLLVTLVMFSLSGCIKVTFKNQSQQMETTVDENAEGSAKVNEATTENDEDVIITGESNKTTEEKIVTGIPNEAVLDRDTEKTNVDTSKDVFTTLFKYDIPAGYQLLEDEYNTNTSKMYVLAKRNKVVATIYLNYVNTSEFTEEKVRQAYKNEIETKYNVIGTSEILQNGFNWDGYVGSLKEDGTNTGYIHLSSYAGETVYIEFMCTKDYECALDVATLIKSFKYAEKEE